MGKNNRVTDLLAGFSLENLEVSGDEVQEQLNQTSEQVEEVEDRVEEVEEQVEEVEETVDEHLTDPDAHSEVETVPAEPDPVEDGEGTDPIGGEVGEAELDLAVVDDEAQASEEVTSVQDEVENEVAVLDEASEIVSNTAEVVEGVDVEADGDVDPVEEIDSIIAVSNERLRLKLGSLGKDLVFNTTSLEGRSFKSVQGRLMAKELALENLDQQKKGIFAKAIEAIKKAWEWIATRAKEIWIKLTGTKKRREKIVAFLKENPVKQKVVVENAQLAQRLGITRSNNVYSDVVDTIANLISVIDVHAKTSVVSFTSIVKNPDIEKAVVQARQLLDNTVLSLGGFGTLSIKLSESSGAEFFTESRVDFTPPTGKFVDSINTLSSDEVIKLFGVLDNSLKRIENDEVIKQLKQGKPGPIVRGMANLGVKSSAGLELSDSGNARREVLAALGNYARLFTTPLSRLIGFLGQLDISVTMLGELTVKVAKGKEADVKGGTGTALALASEGISSTEGGPEVLTDEKDYEDGNDYDLNEGKDPGEFKKVELDEGEIEQTEIGTVSAAIEQFEEMAEVLEEAGEAAELHDQSEEAIEAALSGNGLDETAATFMDIAAEAIHGKMLRLDREYTPTLNRKSVSLENFRKSAYRLEATSASLEDWKETGKGIIEAIKKALAKVVAMIRYVYKQAKTYFKGAEGRVERLRRRLQTTPDTKMSPKPIEDEKSLARFRVGNKALNPSTTNEGLDQLAKAMDAAINDSLVLVSAGEDIIKGKAAEASRVLVKFNNTNELVKLATVKEKDGSFIYTVDDIPGGSEIVITRPKLDGELTTGFKATVTKKTEGRASGVVRTLSKSDAKKVLGSVSTALTKAENTSKELDSLVKMVEDITKGIKDEDFNDSKARSAAKKAVAGLSRVSSGEVFTVIKAQGMAIDTILTWVGKSIGGGEDSTKGNDSNTPLLTQ